MTGIPCDINQPSQDLSSHQFILNHLSLSNSHSASPIRMSSLKATWSANIYHSVQNNSEPLLRPWFLRIPRFYSFSCEQPFMGHGVSIVISDFLKQKVILSLLEKSVNCALFAHWKMCLLKNDLLNNSKQPISMDLYTILSQETLEPYILQLWRTLA